MVGETVVTVVGNLTDDPEIRSTPSGEAVAHFTVASTPRTFDRQSNEWRDADTLFLRCSAWRKTAEHVTRSLTRGTRVIVQGRLHQRTYETREGEKRTVIELEALEIGPSLRYADATVSRIPSAGGPGGTLFDTAPPASNDEQGASDGDRNPSHDHNSPTFPF
ncbi:MULTISPECIES: single-stranded DNA-binding protein [unclassified Streptomyces]|uniref:single-stranded DNA-binding protein n=1 Tax=unclassified Streptomyces TaxID=2593676 RepID=UPI0005AAC8B4|nr:MULTISPECIES: single-stranded DNA-binding protein [unclassified Streptomyces]ODA69351.1 Single-stranded DNA-binding protein [Streptomyces sp. AVP053U2]